MCFYIDKLHPEEQIATENITCYKILKPKQTKFDKFLHRKKIVAPLWDNYIYWVANKKTPAEILKKHIGELKIDCTINQRIEEGLHSIATLDAAKSYRSEFLSYAHHNPENWRIYEAYIPKGSKYYYNSEEKEYVSNEIVVKTKLN